MSGSNSLYSKRQHPSQKRTDEVVDENHRNIIRNKSIKNRFMDTIHVIRTQLGIFNSQFAPNFNNQTN